MSSDPLRRGCPLRKRPAVEKTRPAFVFGGGGTRQAVPFAGRNRRNNRPCRGRMHLNKNRNRTRRQMKAGSVSVFLTLSGGSDPRSFGAEDGDGQENIKYSARICAGRTNSCAVCYSDKECWNVKKWQMRPAGKKEWSTGSRLAVRGSYLLLQPSLRQTANGDPLVVVFRVPGTGQDHFGVASFVADLDVQFLTAPQRDEVHFFWYSLPTYSRSRGGGCR